MTPSDQSSDGGKWMERSPTGASRRSSDQHALGDFLTITTTSFIAPITLFEEKKSLPMMDSRTGAHQDEAPTIQHELRARFNGLIPTQVPELATMVEEECRAKVEEYRAKIEELNICLRELRSIRNAAATINSTLPPEVLMHVFRCIEPDDRQHIRIAHVCRLWRSLLRSTSEFWVRLLDPDVSGPIVLSDVRHEIIISDIVRNSSPLSFGIALPSSCLADVSEGRIVGDLSRLSSLRIVIVHSDSLNSLSCMSLPCLDTLSLWYEELGIHRLTIPPISSSQFPRLHTLETNCPLIARRLLSPAIQRLSMGSSASFICAIHPYRRAFGACCRMDAAQDVLDIMQRCARLETLRFADCLPVSWLGPDEVGTLEVVRMPSLRALTIVDKAPTVQKLLKSISIPATTRLRYEAQMDRHRLSKTLPSNLSCLPMLSSIDEAELRIGSYKHTTGSGPVCHLRGLVQGVERLCISVSQTAAQRPGLHVRVIVPHLVAVFESSIVTVFTVRCFMSSSHLSEDNILWMMKTFRHLRDLRVHGLHQTAFLNAVHKIDSEFLLRLRRLQLGSRNPQRGELDVLVVALESCGTWKGLRLDAFSYLLLNNGFDSTFQEWFGLDDAAFSEYRRRLGTVAGSVILSADKAKLPVVPKL
ncbi:hypothetical protein OH76DRAFT_175675 [Lentinus brumalis]|uniref:F-box domain-containing protein n=1 Tax=Lentinus brumalis TaxID=2498619 RepID=A0A371CNQ6_9APHY|nr:hypothetical protein OH76DRAFT_175675 [Polyporus brumalis]